MLTGSLTKDDGNGSENIKKTVGLDKIKRKGWELIKHHLNENTLILKQVLLTSSSIKCMVISTENMYVDIGAGLKSE